MSGGCGLEAIANAFPHRVDDLIRTGTFFQRVEGRKDAWLRDSHIERILNELGIRFDQTRDGINQSGNLIFIVANSYHFYTYRMVGSQYKKFDGYGYDEPQETTGDVRDEIRRSLESGTLNGCYSIVNPNPHLSPYAQATSLPMNSPPIQAPPPQYGTVPNPERELIENINNEGELEVMRNSLMPRNDISDEVEIARRLSLIDIVQARIQELRRLQIENDRRLSQELVDRELAMRLQRTELGRGGYQNRQGGDRQGRDRGGDRGGDRQGGGRQGGGRGGGRGSSSRSGGR